MSAAPAPLEPAGARAGVDAEEIVRGLRQKLRVLTEVRADIEAVRAHAAVDGLTMIGEPEHLRRRRVDAQTVLALELERRAEALLAIAEAALDLDRYEDFGERPEHCPHCQPVDPTDWAKARRRLHVALYGYQAEDAISEAEAAHAPR